MEAFYITIQIVFGILLPIIIVASMCSAVIVGRSIPHILDLKVQELKKQPPYDEVETSIDFERKSMKVLFIKNGDVVWSDEITDKELMS